jgi:hypothetical protein
MAELADPDGEGLVDPVFGERFEKALSRLQDVIERMPGSSRNEDFTVLQQVSIIMKQGAVDSKAEKREIVEFAKLTSVVSASIIAALDTKYGLGAMALYNRATAGIMGELMERFIEKVQKAPAAAADRSMVKEEGQVREDAQTNTTPVVFAEAEKKNASDVSRSWDSILEEFATAGG